MRPSKLLFALDPLGPLSPLNPRHPLNPLRDQVVRRRPPRAHLPKDDSSLLALLYGDGRLDNLPFPNMEWWWNATELRDSAGHELSLLSNVHLFALPTGWVAQGTLAIRDRHTRRSFQVTTSGMLDPSARSRFTASGWHLRREGGAYVIDVHSGDLHVDELRLEQGNLVSFNDPGGPTGWYDANPDGAIPYWASYRSRFGTSATGEIQLPDNTSRTITRGHSRFDHQSVHFSPRDVRTRSPAVLGEIPLTRPAWLWYYLRVETRRGPLNVVAYELYNANTERVLKRAAAVCGDDGVAVGADVGSVEFERSADFVPGRVAAPRRMVIRFVTNGAAQRSGSRRAPKPERNVLTFRCEDDQGFSVNYPVAGSLVYQAGEIPGKVGTDSAAANEQNQLWWHGERHLLGEDAGTGLLEVLDLGSLVTLGR